MTSILAPITNILTQILQFFYRLVNDWGLAIILLTLVIRIILIPLTQKQFKSMYDMQRIQPKLQELQKKYKDDPQTLQAEMGKFYSENKINPLSGCLPLILQVPILIALFEAFRTGLRNVSGTPTFWHLIPNLTKTLKDIVQPASGFHLTSAAVPYIILVLLMGAFSILPTFLQKNTTGGNTQIIMGVAMGAMMLYFGYIFPAGVLLYWTASSAFAVIQQFLVMRHHDRTTAQTEVGLIEAPLTVAPKQKVKKPGKSTKR